MTFLRIRNWEVWQSYRSDRGQPPWIKVHRRLLHDPNFVSLTDAQRGQLMVIWILAADRNGVIPSSPSMVRKLCYMDEDPDLQAFVDSGFIEGDATVTPPRRQRDHPEERRGREETECAPAARESFEELWSVCRRGSKRQALHQYRKAVPSKISHEAILAAWKRHVESAREPQYVKHLERWIRDERWEESPPSANGMKQGQTVPYGSGAARMVK